MSISLTEDVRALAELKDHPMDLVKQVRATGRPVILTSQGKPDMVLLDAATFERRLKTANLRELLREAEADIAAGRTRPARGFLKELKRAPKASR